MNDLENSLSDIAVEKCYKIAKNSELGRHIVVTKALKKGDIIFKDYPLVTGPSRESAPCCVVCYKLIGKNYHYLNFLKLLREVTKKKSFLRDFEIYLLSSDLSVIYQL